MPTGHTLYSMSALDLRMIQAVPQGGSWKDIPLDVPSKRLDQIRLSGGRTTLYGRLSWDKPSFTITTYFNRPGNGTYIHPDFDRVITSAEAARLQTFPDSYVFQGVKSQRTKQIGNAVPPLLAYAIAKQIKSQHKNYENIVDLFCGAGGMSLGFHWAGFRTVLANDNFRDAAETFKFNNPESKFIFGDITESDIKASIFSELAKGKRVDLVVGGPPCQGFSHAGKRLIDDPRNVLYKEFVEVVSKVRPPIFIMENVEGILSMDKGRVFTAIKEDFEALGYQVVGRKLLAADFGVPQKRKRVIVIGSLLQDPSVYFPDILLESGKYLTVREAIGDLRIEPVEDVNTNVTPQAANYPLQEFLQGLITPEKLLASMKFR